MSPIIIPSTVDGDTFAELQTEFYARGFTYLNQDAAGRVRAKRWINLGYQDLCDEEPWPFLRDTVSGAAPLTIDDVRDIISVTSATGRLEGREASWVIDENPQLDTTGTGAYYYRDTDGSLAVWPSDPASLTVRYLAVPPDMVGDDDEPVIPPRYRYLIVDYAVIRALRDRSNFAEARELKDQIQPDLQRMRESLLDQETMFQRLTDLGAA